jgi:hypothetical protein
VSALLQSECRHTTLSARAEGTAICSRRHSGYIAHHNQPGQTLSPFLLCPTSFTPVVPVSRADQWEAMAPDRRAAVERAGAMLEQGPGLCRHMWLEIRFVSPGCEERPVTACGPVNLSAPYSRIIS